MLKHRTLSVIVWILLIWFSVFIAPGWLFITISVLLIGLGLFEFFNMVSKKGIPVYKYFGVIIGCIIPISMYFEFKPSEGSQFLLMTAVCLAVFLLQFARQKTEHALVGISTTVFGVFYISWLLSFMVKLRVAPPYGLDGRLLVIYILLVTKLGDVAAYFFGTAFGKHQLIPHISPKKSVEGTIAGFLTSFFVAISFKWLIAPVGIVHVLCLGLLLGILSQIGDLSESLIKRDCKVKDSGFIFPGMGGMLDSADSLLFTTPIFYFYLKLLG
ncbi:phosphatidate cytidylyltransferase [Candidatus Omnitrophota bacterium]